MCGIAGILGPGPAEQAERRVRAMLQAQLHRGPDDVGWLVLRAGPSFISLGNCRLAIQDLSPSGHQPMTNPDTGDTLVYNGEIYNVHNLREYLYSEGYEFHGRSDTEVLLRAYERWGRSCLDHLRGMFAFAIWDARRRRLFIARDHLGIKPLYYTRIGHQFAFASEIRALERSEFINTEIDRRALAGYLAYGGVQEPLTIYRDVFSLPRGGWREIDGNANTCAEGTFWQLPTLPRSSRRLSLPILLEEGRSLLQHSVERHLVSDVRVGVFLSSGLDSTVILGLSQGMRSNGGVDAFTVSFPDQPQFNEQSLASTVAARFGANYHECRVSDSTAVKWIVDAMGAMDQPSMDGFNTYIVARAVREQGIAVALSGLGGDEIFGGYDLFRRVPRAFDAMTWLNPLPPFVRRSAVRLATLFTSEVARLKALEIINRDPGLIGLYFRHRRLLSDHILAILGFTATDLRLTEDFQIRELTYANSYVGFDQIASIGRLDASFYLSNVLLRDSDVFGMSNSLEIRVPFLDRDLLEWAFRLPGDVLLPRGAPSKYLLRKMCPDLFDGVQLRQRKRGFVLPMAEWLRGPLRNIMEENLTYLRASGLVIPAAVDRVTSMFHREPKGPAWSRVWALVTLGHWLQRRGSTRTVQATAKCSA